VQYEILSTSSSARGVSAADAGSVHRLELVLRNALGLRVPVVGVARGFLPRFEMSAEVGESLNAGRDWSIAIEDTGNPVQWLHENGRLTISRICGAGVLKGRC
jgi:hypothetical protein